MKGYTMKHSKGKQLIADMYSALESIFNGEDSLDIQVVYSNNRTSYPLTYASLMLKYKERASQDMLSYGAIVATLTLAGIGKAKTNMGSDTLIQWVHLKKQDVLCIMPHTETQVDLNAKASPPSPLGLIVDLVYDKVNAKFSIYHEGIMIGFIDKPTIVNLVGTMMDVLPNGHTFKGIDIGMIKTFKGGDDG